MIVAVSESLFAVNMETTLMPHGLVLCFIFRAGCDVWPTSLLKLWLWLLLLTVILFVLLVSLAVALVAAARFLVFSYGKKYECLMHHFRKDNMG